MKTRIISLLIFFSCFVFGCEKLDTYNPEVENYIDLLKSGSYDSWELPEFCTSDIPALLKYRNDTLMITDFPHNGLSSLWGPDCKLGMYVLWTIESIRAVEINSEYLSWGRFPSLNPILAYRDSPEHELISDEESHTVAAKAYYDWWHSFPVFKNKMDIDPLAKTLYKWH